MNNSLLEGLNGGPKWYGTGGVVAIVAIITVFVVLLAIIVLSELVGKLIAATAKNAPVLATEAPAAVNNNVSPLDINDEDATVAALVASIDYRNETKMNIKVVSVKEVM